MVAGALLVHAQGTISIQGPKGTVVTNTGSISGVAIGTTGAAYDYELLDLTQAQFNGLTAGQQTGIYSLASNQSDISLWTDSGISGANAATTIAAGGVNGPGGGGGTSVANWGLPTGGTYNTGSINYYTIVGWSATMGNWSTVEAELLAGDLSTGVNQFFGQTLTAYNYAGGANSLNAVNLWGGSATTSNAGTGLPNSGNGSLVLSAIAPVPEPATLALAGLGGISMLFLRRRKS